jgi:hypothetical protein
MTYVETIKTPHDEMDKSICHTVSSDGKVTTNIPYQEQLVGYTLHYLLEDITKEQYIASIKALNDLFQVNSSDLKKRRQRSFSGKDIQVWYLDPSFYFEEKSRGIESLLSFGVIGLEEYIVRMDEVKEHLFALIPIRENII